MLRVVKRDKKKREEEDRARAIRQKIEGGREIIVYVNAKAVDRKLLPITSREQPGHILRVKSMIESVVGLTTHGMIESNASDEEMSEEKSLSSYVQSSDGHFHFYQKKIQFHQSILPNCEHH